MAGLWGVVHKILDPVEMPHWPIERTMQHYFGCYTDIMVCGHTHVEDIQRYGDVWVINPGSPTYPRNLQAQLGTVGILRLEEGHRAGVTIYDLKTLQPYPALTIRLK
jgi:uncharacterized protein